MFACALPLYPATPGWGVRCGCVCLGSGFGCAPPLLARVLGCVCVRVHAPLVPRHFWLGCAVWVCVLGFRFGLRPAIPGWGVRVCVFVCLLLLFPAIPGLGVRHGCVCAWARVSVAPSHSWLGFWGVCVLVCVLPLYPATPGWDVRCGCLCLGLGFGCAPPLLAGLLRCACLCARSPCTPPLLAGVCGVCVCAWVRVSAAPGHSWLGCCGVCVLVCALRLYPATPGGGVRRGCVCLDSGLGCASPLLAGVLGCAWLCACSPCSPPLLAGVCGVGVCAWARVSVAPSHSWLGFWGVCVLVCALPLYPATPGWVVRCWCGCLGSGFGCAPPRMVGLLWCVCLCACSPCTPPILAGVCGVGLCVWVRVSAAPRHSRLECWGVCVLVWALPLYPATPCWGVRSGCMCLGSGFGCDPPLLAGMFGCVCAGVGAPPVPRHSWQGCAVWLCVFGLGFGLRPAPPGWGVGVCVVVCVLPPYPATPCWGVRRGCVCLGSGFGCAPPLLAQVLGCVSAGVRAPLVPRNSWLGCAVWVCVPKELLPKGKRPGCLPTGTGKRAGLCVLCARRA